MEGIASCVTGDVMFIGTGAQERARGLKNFTELMRKNIDSSPEPFDYEVMSAVETKESDFLSTVSLDLHAGRDDESGMLKIRCLFVARSKGEEGFKLSSVCLSVANCLQQEDEFFPFIFSEHELRGQLHNAEKKLELTMNSVPGAIAVYELTQAHPRLVYVSDGWKRISGYNPAEYIKKRRPDQPQAHSRRRALTAARNVYPGRARRV